MEEKGYAVSKRYYLLRDKQDKTGNLRTNRQKQVLGSVGGITGLVEREMSAKSMAVLEYLSIDGILECGRFLEEVRDKGYPAGYVEMSACKGGCIAKTKRDCMKLGRIRE